MKNPKKSDIIFLEHILQFIEEINIFENEDCSDLVRKRAEERCFTNIGEAVNNLSTELKSKYKLPWGQISGFRNKLVHNYFSYDENIFEDSIENDLSELKSEIEKILEDLTKK